MMSRLPADAPSARSTAHIVAAYVRHHAVPYGVLAAMVTAVDVALREIRSGAPVETPDGRQTPAVPILRSLQNDCIICIECGARLTMLRQHLAAYHGLTPKRYRSKWKLGDDYPMISPQYAQRRLEIAKATGLGLARRHKRVVA
jgi:predicted transcriptional regulator